MKQHGLTLKQKRFADHYIETGNGTQSVLAAGYNTDYDTAQNIAYENVRKPKVVSYITRQLALKDANPELVLEVLLDKLKNDNDFIALKAAELLGKHLRMFTDKASDTPLEAVKAITWGNPDKS